MSAKRFELIPLLSLLSIFGLAQSCGNGPPAQTVEEASVPDAAYVSADAPEATLTSEVLQKIRGRWVRENGIWNEPDPPTMRLRAVGPNKLSGRLLVSGAYNDVGVAMEMTDDANGKFTMILTDDELRPHDSMPKVRTFSGTWDKQKQELTLKSDNGEVASWEFTGGYTAYFSGSLYRCALAGGGSHSSHTPSTSNTTTTNTTHTTGTTSSWSTSWTSGGSTSGGTTSGGTSTGSSGSGSSRSSGSSGSSSTSGTTSGSSSSGSGSSGHGFFHRLEMIAPAVPVAPVAAPTPEAAPRPMLCGTGSFSHEQWSRMSGAQ
jgi:hypothetical protein